MKKTRHSLAACAATVLFLAASHGIAGEVNGKGKPIPGADRARSECAFSGQQDDPVADAGIFKSDRTQNWGQLTDLGRLVFAMYFGITSPSQGCNPNWEG